jgi:hypothetical protein
MSSERGAWSFEWNGKEAKMYEKRDQLQPWLPSLLMDMVIKLKKHVHGDYACYWDYYDIRAERAEDGPIELGVVGRRVEVGIVEDTIEDYFVVNILECNASGIRILGIWED